MVKTMAVIKNRSLDEILKVIEKHGIEIIGENRIQEARDKFPHLEGVEKHFIGHLQTNKARDAIQLCDVIETVDSEKLASAINKEAEKLGKCMLVFIQINISREPQKGGILAENLDKLVQTIQSLPHLKLRGLMTIAENTQDQEKLRDQFMHMHKFKEKYDLPELSMGMSQDYKLAIECGATIIGLGRALFDEQPAA